jgi:hypothetical protein
MTTAQELRMREPALAMLMGAVPQGENFGFGYGRRHHHHQHQHQQMQAPPPPPPPQDDDSDGYGYGFGYAHPAMYQHPATYHGMHPNAGAHLGHPMHHGHHMARHWEMQNPSSTMSRTLLLDPNRDSIVKVERYSFSFSPSTNLVLGTASNIVPFTQQPSTSIKGQRVIMNAPVPGFVLISSLQVANVNVLVGGTEDAYTYSAGAQGVMLDLPRLDPQNRATSAGAYTGVLPPGYTQGNSYQFIITLQGPSTLAGGYGQ